MVPVTAFPGLAFLAESLIKSTVVLGSGLLLMILLKKQSAAIRHFVLSVLVIGLLLLPALSVLPAGWETRLLPAWLSGSGTAVTSVDNWMAKFGATGAEAEPVVSVPAMDAEGGGGAGRALATESGRRDRDGGQQTGHHPLWLGPTGRAAGLGLVIIWLAGFAALMARLGLGLAGASRLSKSAEPLGGPPWKVVLDRVLSVIAVRRRVRLRSHSSVAIPMTWGLVRPVILMPQESHAWSDDERASALLHEMAHVKRLDFLVALLVRLSLAVFWLNPLGRPVFRRLKNEQEKACDELVLRAGVRPSTYAASLLALNRSAALRWSPSIALLGMIGLAGGSSLSQRLTSILKTNLTLKEVRVKTKVTILAAVAFAVAFIGLARPVANAGTPRPGATVAATIASSAQSESVSPSQDSTPGQTTQKAKKPEKPKPAPAKPAAPPSATPAPDADTVPPAAAPSPESPARPAAIPGKVPVALPVPEAAPSPTAPKALDRPPAAAPAAPPLAMAVVPIPGEPAPRPEVAPAAGPLPAVPSPRAVSPAVPQEKAPQAAQPAEKKAEDGDRGKDKDKKKEWTARTIVIKPLKTKDGVTEIIITDGENGGIFRVDHPVTFEWDASGKTFTMTPGGEKFSIKRGKTTEIIIKGGKLVLGEVGQPVEVKEGSHLVLRRDKSGDEAVVVYEVPGLVIKEAGTSGDIDIIKKRRGDGECKDLDATLEVEEPDVRVVTIRESDLAAKLEAVREELRTAAERQSASEKTLKEVEEAVARIQDEALRVKIQELTERLSHDLEAKSKIREDALRQVEREIEAATRKMESGAPDKHGKEIKGIILSEARAKKLETKLRLSQEVLKRTDEEMAKKAKAVQDKIQVLVEREGRNGRVEIAEEPEVITILKEGEAGEPVSRIEVRPKKEGPTLTVSTGEGQFALVFAGIEGQGKASNRDRAAEEMRKALPEGFTLESSYDQEAGTFTVVVKGSKPQTDSLGLMKKLIEIGKEVLR